MRWFHLLLPAVLVTVSPAASAQTQVRRTCFWPSEVTGFSSSARDRALVHIGKRETWELTLARGCPDIDWAMRIGIRARGGERICPGRSAELIVPGAGGHGARSCLIRDIRRLSPEEAAALRGYSPKR